MNSRACVRSPLCALVPVCISMLGTCALLCTDAAQADSVLCQEEETEKERAAEAIMQVAEANWSYQKTRWLARCKVGALITRRQHCRALQRHSNWKALLDVRSYLTSSSSLSL